MGEWLDPARNPLFLVCAAILIGLAVVLRRVESKSRESPKGDADDDSDKGDGGAGSNTD
jgi:hypothetical protein